MFLIIIGASLIGSVFALVGGALLLWKEELAKKISLTLVSFAAGSLLGAAFLELLPEAFEFIDYEHAALWIIVGILTIFLFEKLLSWHHHHTHETPEIHSFSLSAKSVLLGDGIHNFIDGIVIALSFSAGVEIGIAATIAVFFHEVPQEIGDFGVLIHAGYTRSKVFLYNFYTAILTPIGATVGYLLLPILQNYLGILLAFAAGTFIYIATSDLLPELKHKTSKADFVHLGSIALGVILILLLNTFIPE